MKVIISKEIYKEGNDISIFMHVDKDYDCYSVEVTLDDVQYELVCDDEEDMERKYHILHDIMEAMFEHEEKVCKCQLARAKNVLLVAMQELGRDYSCNN